MEWRVMVVMVWQTLIKVVMSFTRSYALFPLDHFNILNFFYNECYFQAVFNILDFLYIFLKNLGQKSRRTIMPLCNYFSDRSWWRPQRYIFSSMGVCKFESQLQKKIVTIIFFLIKNKYEATIQVNQIWYGQGPSLHNRLPCDFHSSHF